ncbi:MAG: hypothetical protein ACK5XN_21055 [Bacteroidota bacterium]|jgi:hypothetical protein
MTNPNRVLANMSKNPWTLVQTFTTRPEAAAKAEELKALGEKVRVTSYKYGSYDNPRRSWNVWKVPT